MTRRISQSINPTDEDIATLRALFVNKGASDPVITELKNHLKKSAPAWVVKMSTSQTLTAELLDEFQEAAEQRRRLYEHFPEGVKRNAALNDIDTGLKLVEDMKNDLTSAQALGGMG